MMLMILVLPLIVIVIVPCLRHHDNEVKSLIGYIHGEGSFEYLLVGFNFIYVYRQCIRQTYHVDIKECCAQRIKAEISLAGLNSQFTTIYISHHIPTTETPENAKEESAIMLVPVSLPVSILMLALAVVLSMPQRPNYPVAIGANQPQKS